jgi:hypothetical protein
LLVRAFQHNAPARPVAVHNVALGFHDADGERNFSINSPTIKDRKGAKPPSLIAASEQFSSLAITA